MDSWRQYHGDGSNQGFMPVHTAAVMEPKWTADIGKAGYASPVINKDGVIYIGTLKGELVAVNPDGNIKWRRPATTPGNPDYPGIITGSPTIDNDGNIYVISTVNSIIENRRSGLLKSIHVRRSSLHSFTPAGNRRWSYRFPVNALADGLGAYTSASPKTWGNQNIFIFVPAIHSSSKTSVIDVLVINQSGNLVSKIEVAHYSKASEPVAEEAFSAWDYLNNDEDFNKLVTENIYEKIIDWPEPTLAIVDFDSKMSQPVIVIEDNYKTLAAYRWNFPIFTPLWVNRSDSVRQRTTPATFLNTSILLGGKNGVLSCYDLENGDEIFQPWYQASGPITGSLASLENDVYVVAGEQLLKLGAHATVKEHYALKGKCLSSVALSANHVYVNTTDGFYTFSMDLKKINKNNNVVSGVSSPAISQDGVIHVMDQEGKLWAFG